LAVLEKRFKTFEQQSMPIIKYFEELGKLWRIDATKTA
jgi:adenylate kinase family enzyme